MVQKREMISEFEKLTYDSQMLKNSWENQLVIFEKLKNSKITNYGFTNFINWILKTDYSNELFAGSSMWRLLISKPTNDRKLNYQQTLKIEFDNRTSLYLMEYSDWNTINNPEEYKKAILWKRKCTAIELISIFLEFIKWNKHWF